MEQIIIHRAFSKIDIDHIDSDKSNNYIDNLDPKWKGEHAKKTAKKPNRKKVTLLRFIAIKDNVMYGPYEGQKAAIRELNGKVTRTGISKVINGKKKTHAGYVFKYYYPSIDGEIWMPLKSVSKYFENYDFGEWELSNKGRLKNKNGRIKCGHNTVAGYTRVQMKIRKSLYMNRLVGAMFCRGNLTVAEFRARQANHINRNRQDNRSDNIEMLLPKEHAKHTFANPNRSKTNATCKPFTVTNTTTGVVKKYSTQKAAAKDFEVSQPGITRYLKGKTTRKGYVFAYIEETTIDGEIWKEIGERPLLNHTYDGVFVSTKGRIRDKRGRVTIGAKGGGYRKFGCSLVHRIVAVVFKTPVIMAKINRVAHIITRAMKKNYQRRRNRRRNS